MKTMSLDEHRLMLSLSHSRSKKSKETESTGCPPIEQHKKSVLGVQQWHAQSDYW